MSETAIGNLNRLRPSTSLIEDNGSPFCVEAVHDVETDGSQDLDRKKRDLLWGVEGFEEDGEGGISKCNIGGCDRRINRVTGERTGVCKAATYCLKRAFGEVAATSTVAEGQALYGDIMDTCGLVVGRGNAGSFCPRLDCGLSAGVSVDQVPGTHGDCACEKDD